MSDHSPNVEVGWYNEAQFSAPRMECPNPDRYHTYDLQGTEVEVIELVHGLIRGLQPTICLETGTSRGFLAKRIGEALHANGQGLLYTYEPEPETYREASERLMGVDTVVAINEPSMTPWTFGNINFAWFDSLLELRWAEFDFYYAHMAPGCIVGFHDTAPRFGPWSERVRGDHRLSIIDMPTPRGFILGKVR